MNRQSRARMGLLLQALIHFFEFWVASKHIGADSVAQLLEGLMLLKHQREIRPFLPPTVQNWLPTALLAHPPQHCQDVLNALAQTYQQLKWIPSPPDYINPQFGQGFAYTQLVGPPIREIESAFYPSNKVAAGFSIQAPYHFYPPHQHQAVEFYTPLSGTAVWQNGHQSPTSQQPGAFIFHQSNIPHAMETLADPLLCLWAWVGELDRFPTVTSRSWL